jgi:hypothetical protein
MSVVMVVMFALRRSNFLHEREPDCRRAQTCDAVDSAAIAALLDPAPEAAATAG